MNYSYKTSGTCSQQINFEISNGLLKNVEFIGGCNGNLKGIGKLVEGQVASDVADKLIGTTCGFKSTSCPDQLAKAIREALAHEQG